VICDFESEFCWEQCASFAQRELPKREIMKRSKSGPKVMWKEGPGGKVGTHSAELAKVEFRGRNRGLSDA
jgi:hypothetical protein